MKRLKIFKAYFVLWLFVYFVAITNLETFKLYFLSTLTFNIAIVALLAIGTFMLLKAAKDLTMVAGTFGVLMYKRGDISFYLKGVDKIFPSTIAQKIHSRAKQGLLLFTQQEAEDILAWLEEKYSNQNKYNNFFIGTVLMIGLLGTFAGLLGAIASMGGIVSSLAGDDVDIGKIMGDFAVPLSAMAVGFGSSLFGVISAILLSIKGYLLNKAQESLLSGVENWLQAKTVETLTFEEKSADTTLKSHQKSYMDIFVQQISELSKQMKEVSSVNREFQGAFIQTMKELKENSEYDRDFLFQIKNSLVDISQTTNKNNLLVSNSQTHLEGLLLEQKNQQDSKVELFQVVDSLESMDKNIQQRLNSLEKFIEKKSSFKIDNIEFNDNIDFMKKHLSKEEKV